MWGTPMLMIKLWAEMYFWSNSLVNVFWLVSRGLWRGLSVLLYLLIKVNWKHICSSSYWMSSWQDQMRSLRHKTFWVLNCGSQVFSINSFTLDIGSSWATVLANGKVASVSKSASCCCSFTLTCFIPLIMFNYMQRKNWEKSNSLNEN